MQVLLPAAIKDELVRQLLVKKKDLFKCRPPGKIGVHCAKAHLNIPVQAEVFIRKERGTEQRDKG